MRGTCSTNNKVAETYKVHGNDCKRCINLDTFTTLLPAKLWALDEEDGKMSLQDVEDWTSQKIC